MRWMTPELLADFERRSEKWKKPNVTTHLIDGSKAVAVERGKKEAKYRNVRTEVEGIKFDSKKEAGRYKDLVLLQKAGEIHALERQVRFRLQVNDIHICDYIADFTYREDGPLIVEDCKGYRTREYLTKKKLMLACHKIEVKET